MIASLINMAMKLEREQYLKAKLYERSEERQGVKEPLEQILSVFSFHLLKKYGHEPWDERYAQQDFFNLLRQILKISGAPQQIKRF